MDWTKEVIPWIGVALGLTGSVLSLCNWRRASKDPERFDLAAELSEFVNRLKQCELTIQKNLTGYGTEDRATMEHLERWVTEEVCSMLGTIKNTQKLITQVRQWSRLMTSDPFPLTNKKHKLKMGDPAIVQRTEATELLVQKLRDLRLQALKRRVSRLPKN